MMLALVDKSSLLATADQINSKVDQISYKISTKLHYYSITQHTVVCMGTQNTHRVGNKNLNTVKLLTLWEKHDIICTITFTNSSDTNLRCTLLFTKALINNLTTHQSTGQIITVQQPHSDIVTRATVAATSLQHLCL